MSSEKSSKSVNIVFKVSKEDYKEFELFCREMQISKSCIPYAGFKMMMESIRATNVLYGNNLKAVGDVLRRPRWGNMPSISYREIFINLPEEVREDFFMGMIKEGVIK